MSFERVMKFTRFLDSQSVDVEGGGGNQIGKKSGSVKYRKMIGCPLWTLFNRGFPK